MVKEQDIDNLMIRYYSKEILEVAKEKTHITTVCDDCEMRVEYIDSKVYLTKEPHQQRKYPWPFITLCTVCATKKGYKW